MFKTRIGLLLAVAAVTQCFASCGSPDKASGSSTNVSGNMVSDETMVVTAPPVFKEKDLEGDDFTFLIYNEHATDYVDNYICNDDDNGGLIEKAVAERNSETEKMYNINIVADEVFSPKNEAISRIQSGQCDFDVIYEWGTRMSSLALDGQLYDISSIKTVDLTRSYWVPGATDDLNVGGKTYITTNYITMNSIGWANMLLYNKSMYESMGYTDSLYDIVYNGEWTFDKYVDLAISASKDVDGDGIYELSDRYGIWGDTDSCLTELARSAGIKNTVKNEDGSYDLNIYCETGVSIYTAYRDRLSKSNTFITYEGVWQENPDLTEFQSRYKGARYLAFGEGHVLFMPGTLSISSEFAKMKDEYGMLPNPKSSPSQTRYYHFIDVNAPMIAVPTQIGDAENTGLILEYMAYKSEEHLLPAFRTTVVESKRNPDQNDYRMFDIIKNTTKYEWTELYGLDVTSSIMEKMMVSGSFKSVYNRYHSKAKSEIDGCITKLAFIGINGQE